jgi:hypothetical protein
MDMIGADIALGGDIKNVVRREDLTWPELVLMRDIHGEAAVTNVEVVGEHSYPEWDEMPRLKAKYGRKFVRVFGRNPASIPLKPPASIPRWDDEVEVVVKKRRERPVMPNAAFQETEQSRREHAAFQQGGDRPKGLVSAYSHDDAVAETSDLVEEQAQNVPDTADTARVRRRSGGRFAPEQTGA